MDGLTELVELWDRMGDTYRGELLFVARHFTEMHEAAPDATVLVWEVLPDEPGREREPGGE